MNSESDKQNRDDESGGMTRRDFVGNTLIGSGVALLTASAPMTAMGMDVSAQAKFRLGTTIPLPLTGLDKSCAMVISRSE